MADRIVVLKDGTVEAEGTHAELLQQRDRYAELFEFAAGGVSVTAAKTIFAQPRYLLAH